MTDIWQSVNGVYSLQDALILFGLCLGLHLALRACKVSKGKIAVTVIIFGFIFSPLIQPDPPKDTRARIAWNAKKAAIGVAIAAAALYFYRPALRKLEEKLNIGKREKK